MKKLIFFLIFFVTSFAHFGQCAMCKATAESASQSSGSGIAEGLNSGIVYLMVLPYILLLSVLIIFFRKKIIKFFRAE
ncbi:MAG: hypothetical protein ACKO8Q_09890 [Bacteroidota bacterium]|jgi:hypothetical protein